MAKQVWPFVYVQFIRTGLYVRPCTYAPLRTYSPYATECTFRSNVTNVRTPLASRAGQSCTQVSYVRSERTHRCVCAGPYVTVPNVHTVRTTQVYVLAQYVQDKQTNELVRSFVLSCTYGPVRTHWSVRTNCTYASLRTDQYVRNDAYVLVTYVQDPRTLMANYVGHSCK